MSIKLIHLFLLSGFLICTYASPQSPGWTVYNPTNSGIMDFNIHTIMIDDSGNKWIGTHTWGLQKFNGSKWSSFNYLDYGSGEVNEIAIDNQKIVWVGTGNPVASCKEGGLARFDGTNWNLYTCVPGSIFSIANDDSGNTWAGSACWGLTRFNGTTCTRYNAYNSHLPDSSPLPSNFVTSIAIGDSGNKWIGTSQGGLAKFNGTNWTIYNTSNSGLPGNTITSIVIDKGGTKWMGAGGGGLVKFDGTNWTVYNTSNSGLPHNDVSAIAIDRNGTKWIGTSYAGLAKFDGTNWTIFNTSNSGLPDNDIQALAIDANGAIWIGTMAGGLAVFDEALSIKPAKASGQNPQALSCKYFSSSSRSTITLAYSIPEHGQICLQICSLDGKVVKTLVNSAKAAGSYSESWNGRNEKGDIIARGIYFYKLVDNNLSVYGKMNLF
jgi:ligand-binding sensor domain-containing protein